MASDDSIEVEKQLSADTSLINFRDSAFHFTPLHWAVYNHHYLSASLLLKYGADPNAQYNNGETPFLYAAANRDTTAYLILLLNYGGDVKKISTNPASRYNDIMQAAVSSGRLENVKIIVNAGVKDLNYLPSSGETALYLACVMSYIDIAKFLMIDCKADFKKATGQYAGGDSIYVVETFRDMRFPLDSREYKIKMELVKYMQQQGVDYWKCPVPERYKALYDKEYLEKY